MPTLKEEFLHRDRLVRGITDDKMFRITVVKTSTVVADAQEKHGLSPLAAVVLGQTLTGSLLLASNLKGEERITVRIDGNGPAAPVIVEANAVGAVRGYTGNPEATLDFSSGEASLGAALGTGTLSVAKVLYNEARPVTGTVAVHNESPQSALAHYLRQSEQVESALITDVGIDANGRVSEAGGVLVQALPGAPLGGLVLLQQALESLPRLSEIFAGGGYIDTVLHRIGGEAGVRELNRMLVDFFCSCTEDGFVRALSLLDAGELKEMAGKPQELTCHYCSKKYQIPASTMDRLYRERRVGMN